MPRPVQDPFERWFVRHGVPHVIVGYDAETDVWTRALPVLVAFYFLFALNALDLQDSLATNLLGFLAIVVILLAAWAVTNLLRARPPLAWPKVIGWPELAVFVLGPALPALVLGAQVRDAAESVVESLLVLAVVYTATSYGLVPMSVWAVRRLAAELRSVGNLLFRALPLMLVFVTFLFVNAEVWEVAGSLGGTTLPAVIGLFLLVAVGFVLSRTPGVVSELGRFGCWGDVRPLLAGTPADGVAAGRDDASEVAPPPLSRRERLNLRLVLVVSQLFQVVLVALLVFGFLVVFGFLAIGLDTQAGWTGADPDVLWRTSFGGAELVLTAELLRVAGFLGTFAGLYFSIYLVTDASYRQEFGATVNNEVRQVLAVRVAYRTARPAA